MWIVRNFEIDHIQPRSLSVADTFKNLALACQRCNSYRYNFTTGIDLASKLSTLLFNPCVHQWNKHFTWEKDGLEIRGKTAIWRATCDRLDLNDRNHNEGAIVKARRLWMKGGWHPLPGDSIEP
ncbi:MAG: HNH endonuclease [Cyanobacteria bacterium P01_A01_bin.3]